MRYFGWLAALAALVVTACAPAVAPTTLPTPAPAPPQHVARCDSFTPQPDAVTIQACTHQLQNPDLSAHQRARLLIERGKAHARSPEPGEGLLDFKLAVELVPDSADAYLNRGQAYERLGQHWNAMPDYDRAIKYRRPGDMEAFKVRGAAHAKQKRFTKAALDFSALIRFNDKNTQAYYLRGLALYQAGLKFDHADSFGIAVADMNRLLHLEPDHPDAHRIRALGRIHRGDVRAAVADMDEALKRQSDNAKQAEMANEFALIAATVRKPAPEAALRFARIAVALNGRKPEYLNTLGAALSVSGDPEAALAAYRKVIELEKRWGGRYQEYLQKRGLYDGKLNWRYTSRTREAMLAHIGTGCALLSRHCG